MNNPSIFDVVKLAARGQSPHPNRPPTDRENAPPLAW